MPVQKRRPFNTVFLPLALLAAGCFDSSLSSTEVVRPTLVAVDPRDFLNERACTNTPGTLRSYVATFFDVTAAAGAPSIAPEAAATGVSGGAGGANTAGATNTANAGQAGGTEQANTSSSPQLPNGAVALKSSPAVGCDRIVVTSNITLGHLYAVEVDGYDRAPEDLQVAGEPGTRQMTDGAGQPVAPRWKSRCSERPVEAVNRATQYIRFCSPLVDLSAKP